MNWIGRSSWGLPSRRAWLAGCLVYVAFTAGAASDLFAANREYAQLMADLRMLQEQTQQLQVTLNALTDALKVVTSRVDDQGNVTRKALADQRLLVETLGGDVRVVREKLDDTNVRISSLSQEFEALRTTVTAPPPPPPVVYPDESQSTTSDVPGDAPAPAPVPAPTPMPTAGLSPQRLYDTAYADYTSGQWALAITGFEQFLRAFPKAEQADDAQFYMGETYAYDGKLDQAVAAYEKVVNDYPGGDQAPMAYYKLGITLMRLEQVDRARDAFQNAVQKFPDTDAGRLAQQRLATLNRK